MDKIALMYISEPGKISLGVTTKTLWSMYAIGYKNKGLLAKLSETIAEDHTNMHMADVVGAAKAYAYFDYLDIPARDGLVK